MSTPEISITPDLPDMQDDYFLIAIVDADGTLTETSEANNQVLLAGGVFLTSGGTLYVRDTADRLLDRALARKDLTPEPRRTLLRAGPGSRADWPAGDRSCRPSSLPRARRRSGPGSWNGCLTNSARRPTRQPPRPWLARPATRGSAADCSCARRNWRSMPAWRRMWLGKSTRWGSFPRGATPGRAGSGTPPISPGAPSGFWRGSSAAGAHSTSSSCRRWRRLTGGQSPDRREAGRHRHPRAAATESKPNGDESPRSRIHVDAAKPPAALASRSSAAVIGVRA